MEKTNATTSYKGLPLGNSNFKEIVARNFYYVDKTAYIKEVFKDDSSKVFLIARPRRFGKTLAMNTFYNFLKINPKSPDDTSAQELSFKNTAIYQDKEFCQEYMGKFPVIFISLKDVDDFTFELARAQVATEICFIANRLNYLLDSPLFSDEEKHDFKVLTDYSQLASDDGQKYLSKSLRIMIDMLYRYYGRQVIVLIDEYDVPLAKAYDGGYYSQMLKLIRGMLSTALKDNVALFKGVLTGCLRVSKDSIFTGFNNFDVNTVASDNGDLSACMGFTKAEVKTMLDYYHLSEYEAEVKHWYDGYKIAGSEIFCPWDVISFCKVANKAVEQGHAVPAPQSFWTNTSSNDVILKYMPYLEESEAERMQTLLDDGEIEFKLNEKLNYNEIGDLHRPNDFWSLLLYTGYLTATKVTTIAREGTFCRVRIPNEEVWLAFKDGIVDYYSSDRVKAESSKLVEAFFNGDKRQIRVLIETKLRTFISLRDIHTKSNPENFYHGFLNGFFSAQTPSTFGCYRSNTDAGDGYADIMFSLPDYSEGVIIELKSTSDENKLSQLADEALAQIRQKNYIDAFLDDDAQKVYCYGIAFCRKHCRVKCEVKDL